MCLIIHTPSLCARSLLASKFLSPATSDCSTPIVNVDVVVLSLVERASLTDGTAANRHPDGRLATVPLWVVLSAGVWLLIEFCRLSVMPRGGPPTSRLCRRLMASPVVGVTFRVASALSWLFNGGSLHMSTTRFFICKGQLTETHSRVHIIGITVKSYWEQLLTSQNLLRK